jgi:hypothetical protein
VLPMLPVFLDLFLLSPTGTRLGRCPYRLKNVDTHKLPTPGVDSDARELTVHHVNRVMACQRRLHCCSTRTGDSGTTRRDAQDAKGQEGSLCVNASFEGTGSRGDRASSDIIPPTSMKQQSPSICGNLSAYTLRTGCGRCHSCS